MNQTGKKIVSCDPALDRGDECVTYAMKDTKIIDELFQRERDTTKIAANIVAFARKNDIHARIYGSRISVMPIRSFSGQIWQYIISVVRLSEWPRIFESNCSGTPRL